MRISETFFHFKHEVWNSRRHVAARMQAEQPILSLAARRANHDFLTRPIVRQALLIIVPEYDRVAPVLAKPVRAGLFSLVQGSLLQNYALAVGIGRLAADPVGYAASVLLASDGEGEQRLRQAIQGWPLSLRRRINGRFQRLNRIGTQAGCGTAQSHKFRFTKSHYNARESHNRARDLRLSPWVSQILSIRQKFRDSKVSFMVHRRTVSF